MQATIINSANWNQIDLGNRHMYCLFLYQQF